MSQQANVYLVGEVAEDRKSLARQLGNFGVEAWAFARWSEFLSHVAISQPGCIVVRMGNDPREALEMMTELWLRGIEWPVIIVSMSQKIATAVEAMKRGALDFLLAPASDKHLLGALLVAQGRLDTVIPLAEKARQARQLWNSLTPREMDIASALHEGGLNKVIAYQLGISVRTVEAHRAHIMVKLGVRSFAEAMLLIIRATLPILRADGAIRSSGFAANPRYNWQRPSVGIVSQGRN